MLEELDLGTIWSRETLEEELRGAPLEMFWYGTTRISVFRVDCSLHYEEWRLTPAGEREMSHAGWRAAGAWIAELQGEDTN